MYNQAGQLLFEQSRGYDGSLNSSSEYIYLGNHNIAERSIQATGDSSVQYKHTDMLGSVVLNTNSAGATQESTHYQPYGAPNSGIYPASGIGYAGHKMDNATGLSYMQQRYYSPHKGIFLSVDPVGVDTGGGGNFNRFWYANNNPYKYVDPDGRAPRCSKGLCTRFPGGAECTGGEAGTSGKSKGTGGSGGGSDGQTQHSYGKGPTWMCWTDISGCKWENALKATQPVSVPFVNNPVGVL